MTLFEIFVAHSNMKRIKNVQLALIGVGFVCAIIGSSGCQNNDASDARERVNYDSQPDTIRVLCSRLFSSRTYELFLNRFASEDFVLDFVDAGQLRAEDWNDALRITDGVLLTGGADLHPKLYEQEEDTLLCGDIHPVRDSVEIRLLTWVEQTGIPCLGVCRGLQHMNVFAGGTLDPHLPRKHGNMHRAGKAGNTRDTVHQVEVVAVPDGINVELNDLSVVISHHHQGIDRLGAELIVWAEAPDGLAEGIAHQNSSRFPFYVGVQWHPERSEVQQALVEPIGEGFVEAMLQNRSE
jgi:putative glutamine amidotransferase